MTDNTDKDLPEEISSAEALGKYYDVVAACNRCGFCTSYCPTYLATGDESMSPRGRNQTFRALIEGKISDPGHAKTIVDTCLLCGECTSVCFSEVPTAQLMIQARHLINQTSGVPKFLTFFLHRVLPNRLVFYWILKLSFIGKTIGISGFLRRLGVLRKISPALHAADELVEAVPIKFLVDYKDVTPRRETALAKADQSSLEAEHKIEQLRKRDDTVPAELMKRAGLVRRPKVAYFPVCGSQYINPRIGLASLRLCERLKLDFVIPELACCGLPAASYGVIEEVKKIAMENILRLERGSYEALIVDDSSCGSHLKDYPQFFHDDRDWQARAQAVSEKVREISGFLLQRGLTEHLKRVTWTGPAVAYHDPCKAQYGQKITQPPRELLNSIKNLTLVPIHDGDQCCGGGGTYSLVHPELSGDVLSSKIKNIAASGCRVLVTSASSCLLQLRSGLRKAHPEIELLHLTEFLDRVLSKTR